MKELVSAYINQLSADSVRHLENLAVENADKLITEVEKHKALFTTKVNPVMLIEE